MADSENPFLSSFAADDPAPAEPIEPKPTDDQNPFLQTFGDEPAPAPDTNPVTEFFRSANRNLAPALASVPAMGAGAEVGAAIGAATGPAAPIAVPLLGIGGAIVGGIAGQQAVSAAQDWLIDQLPESWQKYIGQSKAQMAKGQQEQPVASFAGGLAPFAITMRPGWGPAAPATNTAIARILASPVTSHVVSGALQGGMEAATEAHAGEPLDPTRIAIATGFGLVFDKPTKLGERLTSIGAAPVTAVRRAANIPLAPHEMPPPEAEAPAEQAPTVAEANEANVMGPGVTEGVFMGTEKRTPETAVAAQKTVDDETAVLNPAVTIPDPTTVAARMEPELFAARDDLLDTRADLADRLAQVRDTEAEAQPAESAALQLQINAVDTRLREMGPDIAAAHRRAADAVGSEVIEPENAYQPQIHASEPPSDAAEAPVNAPNLTPQQIERQSAAIAEDVTKNLLAANRPSELAGAEGQLIGQRYVARAAGLNNTITPEALYREEGPVIRARAAPVNANALAQSKRDRASGYLDTIKGVRRLMTLTRNADASTVVHESGHQWLEELHRDSVHPAATDRLKDDAQTIRDWLGIKDIGDPITTRQHERFARATEQYMREGVAPSAKLASVFAKFKVWMTDLYQTIRGLGQPINEDVRQVFDRLLAAEPNRTVISPERDVPSGITDLHEHEAETVQPKYAEPAMDRVLAERDDLISQQPTEVQNELARAEAELAARTASPDAGAETGTGADGKPEVVADSGNSGPQPEGGAGSGERGALDSGGTETRAEGPSASAPSAGPDSGLRDDRPGAVNPVGPPAIAPDPATSIDRAASGLVDKAGNIRLDNINTPENVKQVLRDMAQQNNDFIDLRRGVIKAGQLQDLADALGVQPDRLLARRVGQAFNGEEIKYAEKVLAQSAQDLAASMKPGINATAAEVQAYASKMARHQMIQGQFSGLTAEAGRAFAALRRSKALWSPEAKAADLAAKQMTGKTLFQLKQEMALGAELDTPEKISKFANDANKPSFMDGVVEYWIGALLAGPKTLMVNDVSNMVMAVNHFGLDTAAAALSGRIRRALGREGSAVHLGEIGAAARSLGKAGPVALKASVEAYTTGKAVELPSQTEKSLLPFVDEARMDVTGPPLDETVTYRTVMPEVFGLVKGSIDAVLANGKLLMAGGIADSPLVSLKGTTTGVIPDIAIRGVNVLPVGQIARRGFRALSAHDSFFRAANFTIEKARIGYRTALDEGLVPGTAAFDQRVTDVSSNMTPDQLTEATDAAAELTFLGKRGPFTQALVRVANSKPFGLPLPKFVVPFVATPLSIIERAISNRSPLAFLSPEVRADLMGKNGNVAQDMATGRLIMGTLYGVAGLGLVSMKLLNGSAPANSNDAAAWRMAGNQEHSVRVGDTWYQISQLGSVGLWLSMVADAASVGASLSKGEWDSVSSGIMQAFYQNIVDMSSLTGVSDLMQAIQQSDRYGNQYVSKFLASFIPADVAQWNRWTDPYVRDARTVLDTAKSRIPVQSETLPPRRDIWGDPIPQNSTMLGLYARQAAVDPINKVFLDAGYWPGTVDRKIRGVALTPQQYDEFSMLAGRMAKQQITARIIQPGWQQLPAQQKHDALQQVIKWSREAARNAIMAHYPTIPAQATNLKMSVTSVQK